MVTKRLFLVLLIAALAAVALFASRIPLAGGQGESGITINLTPYEGNPILEKGPSSSWDGQSIHDPSVVYHDGLYHMFYVGDRSGWTGGAVGYASSVDGKVWEEYASNPVLEGDGTGFDSKAVVGILATVEGDTWVLYYLGQEMYGSMTRSGIGRATASDPTGAWTREEDPVLTPGSPGEWDDRGVAAASVIATEEGYVMYYEGGDLVGDANIMIGMATSLDGITWTKYDDPATTESPYAESDPVLQVGLEGWTMSSISGCSVRQTTDGWEMFYSEKGWSMDNAVPAYRIGYATSFDGIHWTKYSGFPVLTYVDDPGSSTSAHLLVGSCIMSDSTYYLYYDYHWSSGIGIGVATGTVTRE
jgi:predicted GH43/DUF377 family glycosyl hydrolase